MCTAVTYKTKDFYFGRTLDLEYSYNEEVVITPRGFNFKYRHIESAKSRYAVIGMANVEENYPLYYDAMNERGLGMAGLSFPESCRYKEYDENKKNVSPFEFIPYILTQCADIGEAMNLLNTINLVNTDFSEKFPLSPLHWIITDREKSITVECTKEGLKIYENEIGVLTNEPEFTFHKTNLRNYMTISKEPAENNFTDKIKIKAYSKGMGALGLPGDLSSASRFIRAAFTKLNSVSGEEENESVSQFFHILGNVSHPRGLVYLGDNKYEITVYTGCMNLSRGVYYYTTYENSAINAVDMKNENLENSELIRFPLINKLNIFKHN
ncbi:MAG: choloylglycine hydrolase family protein [Ruminococcaceae bacterium]|nr:choloylglycine hydrolase family protein [Oscillospiraceae bacterium]